MLLFFKLFTFDFPPARLPLLFFFLIGWLGDPDFLEATTAALFGEDRRDGGLTELVSLAVVVGAIVVGIVDVVEGSANSSMAERLSVVLWLGLVESRGLVLDKQLGFGSSDVAGLKKLSFSLIPADA